MQLSGRRVDDSFSIDDVGSTLLEDLAKGLYIPEEVLREYIQNAIDAHRQWKNITGTEPEGAVQVEIRDEAISILDYGIGMDENDIKRVKAIAVSNKPISLVRLTGHKGVGIWAGLSYFDHITIKSTKRGVDHRYELTIWFKKIVESINDNTNIGQALNPNYEIYEYPDDTSYHYTIVTLYSPSRGKEIFLDEANVMKAINSICPCKIDPTFVYHSDLCNWYSANEFETYDIKVNGKIVYRTFPSNVTDFKTGTLTINDRPVAKYWHVINKRNGKLDEINDQLTGFRIIQNGFTLGEQNLYSKENMIGYDELKVGQLINWYVGEFHVILPDLRTDLRRNGI